MVKRQVFGFVVFVLYSLALNVSDANAQSQSCVDFESFSSTLALPSPVVAPPGDFIPSDFYFYVDSDPLSDNDEYAFLSWVNPSPQYTGTFLAANGTLDIKISNPSNNGLIYFDLVHFNQADIEYRAFDSTGVELTNGWTFQSGSGVASEVKYNVTIGTYFGTNVGRVMIRNLSHKTGVVKFCMP